MAKLTKGARVILSNNLFRLGDQWLKRISVDREHLVACVAFDGCISAPEIWRKLTT
jgi:hypothetical protein